MHGDVLSEATSYSDEENIYETDTEDVRAEKIEARGYEVYHEALL